MARWVAHYRCTDCEVEWHQPAGPTQCPRCGCLYVRWLNYETLANPRARQLQLAREIIKKDHDILAALAKT